MTIKMSLYDISEEIMTILGSEEWTDETENQLEKLNLAMEAKAEKILDFCSNLEAFAIKSKEEEKRLASNRKAVENRIDRLHDYIKKNMESVERTELQAGTRKLKIQNNPESVIVDDENKIPARFFVVIPAQTVLDKKSLAIALKTEKIDGAHLERGTHLRIR